MDMKSQRIAYIGKKAVKKDNIAGTGIMWAGFGDVQEVPHGPAVKMLNHPDVWITEKEFKERFETGGVPEDATPADTGLSQVQTAAPAPAPQPAPVPAPEPEPQPQPTPAPQPAATQTEKSEPIAQGQSEQSRLFEIFSKLTDDDISKFGPKAPVVREKLGRDISVEEIKAAWEVFKANPAAAVQ